MRAVTRLYQGLDLSVGQSIQLDDQASHRLARVLRAAVGDPLIVFNGYGGEYAGVITAITKKYVSVDLNHYFPQPAESPLTIHLAQGIPRSDKMDWIIQKAVELGVHKIIPLITEHSDTRGTRRQGEERWSHWRRVALSACEQSGRHRIPDIASPIRLAEWLPSVQVVHGFLLSPQQSGGLTLSLPVEAPIVLLVGPEGGFSPTEIRLAMRQGWQSWCLGSRILRVETAAIAAISIVQYRYGDMRSIADEIRCQ
jgi:16S rRNA (uracil1498-N3)-methyltransferase